MKVEGCVYLDNLRFHAFHGVLQQERLTGNDYIMNVRAKADLRKAMETDEVADTLNYATVYDIIAQEMAIPSNLLEHVCGRIAKRLFKEFPQIETLDLRLTKVNPPMGADSDGAGVEIHFEKREMEKIKE